MDSSDPDPPPGDVTKHILREIRHGHAQTSESHADDSEHEEHIDERWLVSYADMMTLLFGLFVMLYAMAPQMQKVQESLAGTFDPKPTQAPVQNPTPHEAADPSQEVIKQLNENLAQKETTVLNLEAKLLEIQKTNLELNEQLALEKERSLVVPSPTPLPKKTEAPKNETAPLLRQITELKKELALRPKVIPPQNIQAVAEKSFIAIAISWPSKDHDIDLIVEDPAGKVFHYRARNHANRAGNFVLDTRRGPGAELWQADQVYPGTYKISYIFYNNYGNLSPATVNGTIFTAKGSYALRSATLDKKGSSQVDYRFSIDALGNVKIIP